MGLEGVDTPFKLVLAVQRSPEAELAGTGSSFQGSILAAPLNTPLPSIPIGIVEEGAISLSATKAKWCSKNILIPLYERFL